MGLPSLATTSSGLFLASLHYTTVSACYFGRNGDIDLVREGKGREGSQPVPARFLLAYVNCVLCREERGRRPRKGREGKQPVPARFLLAYPMSTACSFGRNGDVDLGKGREGKGREGGGNSNLPSLPPESTVHHPPVALRVYHLLPPNVAYFARRQADKVNQTNTK